MNVDWITVAAQIVNFLVLVWLLKRFLYKPVLQAMDAREKRIAERLELAESERETAALEAARFREQQRDLEAQWNTEMERALEEADVLRKSLQSSAREEVASKRSEWIKNLDDEKDAFLDDIRHRSAEAFSAMARRAFSDLANERLEDQIARRFETALRSIDEDERKKLKTACRNADGRVSVRTGFDLSPERRSDVAAVFHEAVTNEADFTFEISRELICGVELRVGGQVVRWSLDNYLDEVEADLRQAVESRIPQTEPSAAG